MTVFGAHPSSSVRTLRADDDPQWLRVLVFVAAAAVAAFGSVGLLLAVLGWYRRLAVLGGGVVALAALCVCARPLFPRRGTATRTAHVVVAVIAVVAVAGITIWNASNASHQVLIIRDGGTYLNTGKWISGHGSLEVRPFAGPFTADSGLAASSAGMNRQGDHLDFTLAHLFPALLAEAQGLGGDGLMFTAAALLGGLALLAFYLLARRVLLHPIAALGATLCLGLTMPQVAFSRDSTTEIRCRCCCSPRCGCCATRAHSGASAPRSSRASSSACSRRSTSTGSRSWSGCRSSSRSRGCAHHASVAACSPRAGARPAVCCSESRSRSSTCCAAARIISARCGSTYSGLSGTAIISAVAAIAFVAFVRWWTRRADAARPRGVAAAREPSGRLGGPALVLVGGFGAWIVRPQLQTVRSRGASTVVGLVQRANHLKIDPTRRYFEHSVQWVAWYLGAITVTLAIVGAAYATLMWVRGRLRLSAQIAALVLAPPTLLYLWRPSITPDHIWVMRRFVPAILRFFVLVAFGALNVLAERRVLGRARRGWDGRRSLALALGVAAIVYPAYTLRNVTQMTQQQASNLPLTRCATASARAARCSCRRSPLRSPVLRPADVPSSAMCPVSDHRSGQTSALTPRLNNAKLHPRTCARSPREWAAQGRKLFVVAANRGTIKSLVPHAKPRVYRVRRNDHLLEQTLLRRPDSYQPEQLVLVRSRNVPAAG
jgi:hypothetical protein